MLATTTHDFHHQLRRVIRAKVDTHTHTHINTNTHTGGERERTKETDRHSQLDVSTKAPTHQ